MNIAIQLFESNSLELERADAIFCAFQVWSNSRELRLVKSRWNIVEMFAC